MPHRVLVVDDEEAIRSLVKDYLEGQGYLVSCAADGDEGIRTFKSDKPSVVLIDFLLPRKNGFAVAEAIRKDRDRAQTPIIMMSGVFKNPKTAVEARDKYRVVDFLSKPLDLKRIASLIEDAVQGIEPEEEIDEPPLPVDQTVDEKNYGGAYGHNGRMQSMAASISSEEESPPPRGLSYYGRPTTSPPPVAPSVRHDKKAAIRVQSNAVQGGVFVGRPFPALGDEGDLDQMPVAMLLSTIRYDEVTGMLDLTDQGTHRRIYITRGLPTFMQSNAEGENVGALLLRRGRITEPDFQRCLTYMKAKSRTLQQALLELRLATEHDLATAYKLLAGQLMPLALGMASGRFKWRETDAFIGRVPEGNFEPVQVLFEGIKRHVHPPQILKFFKGREDVPIIKTTEYDRLMPFFRRAFSANNVSVEITGKSTYREITRKLSAQASAVVPQLFGLATSGMCVLPEITEDNAMEVAVNAMAAEVQNIQDQYSEDDVDLEDDGPSELTNEERRAQASINKYYDEIVTRDFFQIFGADRDADVEKIKTVYFELAKKWHADTYANMNLGRARPKLDAIFQRITEAYDTITDKGKREEYMVYMDRQAKGLPTDVNQILKGEQLFDQAMAMMRRRDFVAAKPVLEEAIRLNPGDPLYYAHLGWTVFNINVKSQVHATEAVNHLRRAVQESENCSVAYQFLGAIAFSRGQAAEAKKWWQKCLEWEPNNIEAARGLRMLTTREDKDRSGKNSILGKLLNKKT
jgi:CheY-like chemotaxis protein/tetratricopeptide (TPR) repeat protein